MKTLIHIRGLFPDRIGKDVYEHLETLYPEGKRAHIFGAVGLHAEDERVQALVAYLTEVNFSREMYFERVYEPEDYAQSEYFKIMRVDNFGSLSERNSSGGPCTTGGLRARRRVWRGWAYCWFCRLRPHQKSHGGSGAEAHQFSKYGHCR